ncbi:MAG: FAD-dependent oxidoreductase [Actinomycetota bacterium]|nr:FAD-dependent oxidoreductase [Actinomycetota bacterium]
MARYDLVVLGGGAAGLTAARICASLGGRVALVEAAGQPGGDCLFGGCVPSKSLIASAGLAHAMRTADRLGLEASEPQIDFGRVMDRVQEVIRRAGEPDTAEALVADGVEVVRATGRFTRPGAVAAGGRELSYRAALIATGSFATVPPIPGLAGVSPLTNETIWELRELPERLAILGGGPVGVELAQAFARLGSRVTIVEGEPELLPREEPEAGRFVAAMLEAEGIELHRGVRAERVEGAAGGAGTLTAGAARIEFDRLLVAVGRTPRVEGLGLENVGVELTDAGAVRVDARMRTTGDRTWAAGDVTGQLYLTHVAAYHAVVATVNALFRARRSVDHSTIPWVTFTDPEVARVGRTQSETRDGLGAEPLVFRYDYAKSDRALAVAEAHGFVKLVSDKRGRLLGATIVAPSAGESIAEVARLTRECKKLASLSQQVHAYPTFAEGPARAADEWWMHKYLNPRGRRWFKPLLALLRTIDRPRSGC